MKEKTFLMIKPDGVARGEVAEVVRRVEAAGFKFLAKKQFAMSRATAEKLYAVHQGKHFFNGLLNFITSGEVVVSVVEGENVIFKMRDLMGATDPREAARGTIRGDLREENVINHEGIIKNIVHGSDSKASADYEIPIFFGKEILK